MHNTECNNDRECQSQVGGPSAAFVQFAAWECNRELEMPMYCDDIDVRCNLIIYTGGSSRNPEIAAPLLSKPVFSSGQYFSRSMPMVYSAPKSHEGSYLHQRRESRGARCLEGTFATLRVLVPRSCGSTMDQHERYHRLYKDADISSICRSRETKHPIDTLVNPFHLRDHYYFNDTLTFDTQEFGFSGIPLERTIDGSGVPQTYGAEGESRWLLWRTALRYKAIERA
ncbi:hypothetical protein ALC56_05149 [Trachymyrmex septentrionalis]|uniref:Uncharacterized protein n=1 Tax=Trachymyrmex septentrionalis TaxID=34720 RepID=A0A195FHN4_9HYME|nr:hypothetical protein ALC56_05149 [Trachymyrmex septentrionalis]